MLTSTSEQTPRVARRPRLPTKSSSACLRLEGVQSSTSSAATTTPNVSNLTNRLINPPASLDPARYDHDSVYEMASLFYQQPHPQVYSGAVVDGFGAPDASAYATLPLPAGAAVQTHGYIVPTDAYALASYQEQIAREHALYVQPEQHVHDLQAANNANIQNDAGAGVSLTVDVQKNNQDQIAALVNSRDREVTLLQTTLAMPLAHFNAKFIWHCIMNIEQDCDPVFVEKIKTIHKTFYLPPAISFYALWLHFRFWDQMPQVYGLTEALLPPATASTSLLSKSVRVGIILYMMAASFANKHLDDFSYRNSSWYEAARMPAKDFLEIELLALKELQWSLEITSKDWMNWLLYLRTCNITLERTRPTEMNFHFVVARLIQDAIVSGGGKDELLKTGVANGLGRLETRTQTLPIGKSTNMWHDNSPTLVASSQGASPPSFEGLHARINGNIADGPFGLHALQRKLEMIQRNPESSMPRFIPWDTSLDPVVQVQSRSRSSSGSGAPLGGDKGVSAPVRSSMLLDGARCRYDADGVVGPASFPPYGEWVGQPEYGGGYGEVGKKVFGSYNAPTRPVTCGDVLSGGKSNLYPIDYDGMTGMMGRPYKTCKAVDNNLYDMPMMGHPVPSVMWPLHL